SIPMSTQEVEETVAAMLDIVAANVDEESPIDAGSQDHAMDMIHDEESVEALDSTEQLVNHNGATLSSHMDDTNTFVVVRVLPDTILIDDK
ncbi:hypothetical protein PFISCL1PPCAC_29231, partial [Pristionchus fissidentatus]